MSALWTCISRLSKNLRVEGIFSDHKGSVSPPKAAAA